MIDGVKIKELRVIPDERGVYSKDFSLRRKP